MQQGSFQEYFEGRFQADLAAFLAAMPEGQRKHYMKSPESYSISMNYLVDPKLALHVIPLERRPFYAVSLYFTSVMDQSMYEHRQEYYSHYRRLTDYPKLTGACPGACMYIAEPSIALERTNLFDVDPVDYIQSRSDTLFRNRLTLAPILKEGAAYFRHAFPAFLRQHFPRIADPDALYRQVFDDWSDVQPDPLLLAEPKVIPGPFHIAAGWGPVVEVRSESKQASSLTLTLEDEFRARLELDFEAATGAFSGLRLNRYYKVGERRRPGITQRKPGLPCLNQFGGSAKLMVGPIVCSKNMTSKDRGDLFIGWSARSSYDLSSSFPISPEAVLHFYYNRGELAALCLERVAITIFNEMPAFSSNGR
jgi:hypothetical protein